MKPRCGWAEGDELLRAYHDSEWSVPLHEDGKLFEFLVLDAFQAGLSWLTILKKRENLRRSLDGFDPRKISGYTDEKVEKLLCDPRIIRNRRKIQATIVNAVCFLEIQKHFSSFDRYIWRFTGGKTRTNTWQHLSEIPTRTPQSDEMSRDLKARGFKFVGSTICYAFMQAAGMVNDHLTTCFRYGEV